MSERDIFLILVGVNIGLGLGLWPRFRRWLFVEVFEVEEQKP